MTVFSRKVAVARARRGARAYRQGVQAENIACAVLEGAGWKILGRRVRTAAGELDVVAEKDGLLVVAEVKARPNLTDAAYALGARQQKRIIAATEALLAEHPDWGRAGVRFDVLLVDATGGLERIEGAFRVE